MMTMTMFGQRHRANILINWLLSGNYSLEHKTKKTSLINNICVTYITSSTAESRCNLFHTIFSLLCKNIKILIFQLLIYSVILDHQTPSLDIFPISQGSVLKVQR